MKTKRRIEITAFRRRTTIILRDRPVGSPVEPPRVVGADPSRQLVAEPSSGHGASAGQLENPEDREETVTKKPAGPPS